MFDERKAGKMYNFIWVGFSAIFVASVLIWAYKDTEVTFNEEGMEIHGMYGGYYTWAAIKNVELKEDLPTIQLKLNGSSLCGKLKGHFRSRELGNIKVFLDKRVSPFIYFDNRGKKIIFNLHNSESTIRAFERIREKTKS
jgi:hypothetical protein